MSNASSSYMTSPVSAQPEEHLLRGVVIGMIAAFVLMPVHAMMVSWTYHDGYYTEYRIVTYFVPVLVGLAARLGSGTYGPRVALIAVPIVFMHMLGSDYLVARYLINEALVQEGYYALPLIVDIETFFRSLGYYFENDTGHWIMWVGVLIVTGFLAMTERLTGGVNYRLSGKAPAGFASPAAAAAKPGTMPPSASAKVRMEDIPAEAQTLGQPIQVYTTRVTELMLMGGLFILLAAACGIWAVSSRTTPGLMFIPIGLGLLFLGLGIYRFYIAIQNVDNQVIVFADGISISQKGRTDNIRWADIRAVWQRQYRLRQGLLVLHDEHYYRIEPKNGFSVTVDKTYAKIGDLGAAIQTAVTRMQIQPAVEALRRGESVTFGSFTVRMDALVYLDQTFPWQELGSVGISQSKIRINKKKMFGLTRWTPDMSTVPNLHLFFTLVYALMKGTLPTADTTLPEQNRLPLISPYDQSFTF